MTDTSKASTGPVGLSQVVGRVEDEEAAVLVPALRVVDLLDVVALRAVPLMEQYSALARLDGDLPMALDLLKWIGVRHCHTCGCTEEYGCPEGCHWIDAELCSQCKPSEIHAYVIADVTDERDQVARATRRRDVECGITYLHFHHQGEPCTARCAIYEPETTP